jgi:hypothetical protein
LQFRIGQEWDSISQELNDESLIPIPFDQKILSSHKATNLQTARNVKEYQRMLVQEETERELLKEKQMYDSILQQSKQIVRRAHVY